MRIKKKFKGYLYLEDIFGFCKSFKKVTKNLGFHLMYEQLTYIKLNIHLWVMI